MYSFHNFITSRYLTTMSLTIVYPKKPVHPRKGQKTVLIFTVFTPCVLIHKTSTFKIKLPERRSMLTSVSLPAGDKSGSI